ncbi:conserved hypothetical protein [Bradyrhizobium sp. STM 3843]|uniref:hypothetical protein n=1 Tax=Bradyrhizobium sp. STM 3843 TaxID=551947 RepID=UPI000240768B|nr:hypothetical protein [Bradyrhizobium sp. STM 3843]CCE06920.1 conserved hypothetical protein [Bradyrhizobium sp. STM 3843]
MAKDFNKTAGALGAEKTGGKLSGLLAEENEFDRRTLWRIGWWAAAALCAVVIAVLANQAALGWRRDHVSAADLARQAQLLQSLARETQSEQRQLASAIETLNNDRDRLYARVTVLEQGWDSMTGALAKPGSGQGSGSGANAAQAAAKQPQASAASVESQPSGSASSVQAPASSNGGSAVGQSATATSPTSPPAGALMVAPVATTASALPAWPQADSAKPGAGLAQSSPAGQVQGPASPSQGPSQLASNGPMPSSAASLVASKSAMGAPDPAAGKLVEPDKLAAADPDAAADGGSVKPADSAEAGAVPARKTEFAVDLGGANSLNGLRALWRGLSRTNKELATLRPIIIVKEGNTGLGMQLRLGAGPLADAAAAAKICANLAESQRACETTVYDGQRLAIRGDEADQSDAAKAAVPPMLTKPTYQQRRRAAPPGQQQQRHGAVREEPPAAAAPPPPAAAPPPAESSTLSSFFRRS